MAKENIAKEDITAENELGQTVVLVPAGQPIPEDFDKEEYARRTVAIRNADDDTINESRVTEGPTGDFDTLEDSGSESTPQGEVPKPASDRDSK
jgi:hypothetical protein